MNLVHISTQPQREDIHFTGLKRERIILLLRRRDIILTLYRQIGGARFDHRRFVQFEGDFELARADLAAGVDALDENGDILRLVERVGPRVIPVALVR